MPTATNAHGSTNLSQYPKPSSYGSGYGSGYDALGQSQDYAKGGYAGSAQAQTKAGGVGVSAVTTGSSAATDLSAMYGKSHAALGKVNVSSFTRNYCFIVIYISLLRSSENR